MVKRLLDLAEPHWADLGQHYSILARPIRAGLVSLRGK